MPWIHNNCGGKLMLYQPEVTADIDGTEQGNIGTQYYACDRCKAMYKRHIWPLAKIGKWIDPPPVDGVEAFKRYMLDCTKASSDY